MRVYSELRNLATESARTRESMRLGGDDGVPLESRLVGLEEIVEGLEFGVEEGV